MPHYSFFAFISRLKNIGRWALMRNTHPENVQEHSHMVAVIAHGLAVIRRDVFGGDIDPNKAAASALFHDASEIFTGDMPTPIKYHNDELMAAYKQIERLASDKLVSTLPAELQDSYRPLFADEDVQIREIVKAADKMSAYIKCLEELKAGNDEFLLAARQTKEKLLASPLPEVKYFMDHFINSFELTLDELNYSVD